MAIPLSKYKISRNNAVIRMFTELWVDADANGRQSKQDTIEHIGCKMQVSANTIRGILKSANLIGKGAKI